MQYEFSYYKCPLCKGSINWSLNSSVPGASSQAWCSNSLTSSRANWDRKLSKVCFWKGKVERKKNGEVRLLDASGRLLNPVLYKK